MNVVVNFGKQLPYTNSSDWVCLDYLLNTYYAVDCQSTAFSNATDLDEIVELMCHEIVRNGRIFEKAFACEIPEYDDVDVVKGIYGDYSPVRRCVHRYAWNHLKSITDLPEDLGDVATLGLLLSFEDIEDLKARPDSEVPEGLTVWYLNKPHQVRIRLFAILFRMSYVVSRTDNEETSG